MLRLCEWLEQIPWIVTITNSAVLISLVWLVHYFGFFLLIGTTAVVDLRVLGAAARNQKLAPLAGQLFPLAWTGLGLVHAKGKSSPPSGASFWFRAPAPRTRKSTNAVVPTNRKNPK